MTAKMIQKAKLLHKELTDEVLGSFFTVYNELGYGFSEPVYANAMSLELRLRGIHVEREVAVEVQYMGQPVGHYRMDMVVNGLIVLEFKAGPELTAGDRKQLFNYLRASKLELGLLLHFGPSPGFRRIAMESRKAEKSSASSA